MIRYLLTLVYILLACGCSSGVVNVYPVNEQLSYVCIKSNPKVIISGFEEIIYTKIKDKGIVINNYNGSYSNCNYIVTYTALRSWDIFLYLASAKIEITSLVNRSTVGYISYTSPGYMRIFDKWGSANSIIPHLMDRVLKDQHAQPENAKIITTPKKIEPVFYGKQKVEKKNVITQGVIYKKESHYRVIPDKQPDNKNKYISQCQDKLKDVLHNKNMDIIGYENISEKNIDGMKIIKYQAIVAQLNSNKTLDITCSLSGHDVYIRYD